MYREEINTKKGAEEKLLQILQTMHHEEEEFQFMLSAVHPNFHISSRNFIHYLAMRSLDIRPLQHYLHKEGLSALSNSEGHTLEQVQKVLKWLKPDHEMSGPVPCDFRTEKILRSLIADRLLGESDHPDSLPSIMVTFSSEFADSVHLIEELLNAGMNIARINCAHDSPKAWLKMIENLKRSVFKTGKPCKVYMDIAGPKIRTKRIARKKGLKLHEGMRFFITSDTDRIRPSIADEPGSNNSPAVVATSPVGIIDMMNPGDQVYFDDGKFKCRCTSILGDMAELEVVRISSKKALLREEKGINLPDSELWLDALTEEDLEYMPFICEHADLVGYSFVQTVDDIRRLREEMSKYSRTPPSIILKIERLRAVQNLPSMILEGMRDPAFGVMIARGDLAVEIGFERLSEIQEEILCLCEAAHVPVIWATQVLEKMSKSGFAARAEISDVILGGMADCVMLNKGPYVVKSVNTLIDILERRSRSHDKKRYLLRPLSLATRFFDQQAKLSVA